MKKILLLVFILSFATLAILFNKELISIINLNFVFVNVDKPLSQGKVKIEYGISVNTINRKTDLALFENREKYTLVYDGKRNKRIKNSYGENDFLITYGNKHYFSFSQFKTDRKNQHKYFFYFEQLNENIFLNVEIRGNNSMKFKRKMLKISEAENYVCNTRLEKASGKFNMIEFKEK